MGVSAARMRAAVKQFQDDYDEAEGFAAEELEEEIPDATLEATTEEDAMEEDVTPGMIPEETPARSKSAQCCQCTDGHVYCAPAGRCSCRTHGGTPKPGAVKHMPAVGNCLKAEKGLAMPRGAAYSCRKAYADPSALVQETQASPEDAGKKGKKQKHRKEKKEKKEKHAEMPTAEPTAEPTVLPTAAPTAEPTAEPTVDEHGKKDKKDKKDGKGKKDKKEKTEKKAKDTAAAPGSAEEATGAAGEAHNEKKDKKDKKNKKEKKDHAEESSMAEIREASALDAVRSWFSKLMGSSQDAKDAKDHAEESSLAAIREASEVKEEDMLRRGAAQSAETRADLMDKAVQKKGEAYSESAYRSRRRSTDHPDAADHDGGSGWR